MVKSVQQICVQLETNLGLEVCQAQKTVDTQLHFSCRICAYKVTKEKPKSYKIKANQTF